MDSDTIIGIVTIIVVAAVIIIKNKKGSKKNNAILPMSNNINAKAFCVYCGKHITAGSKFCEYCGKPQQQDF